MSGQNKGCAVFLEEKVVLAVHNYYANHDFNLVPGKSSKVPEIHIMLDSMKQLGIFFKYLPKRCHRFEDCVEKHSATFLQTDSLPKRSVRCFANRNEWKNHCIWRLSEDVWATPIISWKHYISRWLGRQQCYSGVGTFKINSKFHFHCCFSHNKIFIWLV